MQPIPKKKKKSKELSELTLKGVAETSQKTARIQSSIITEKKKSFHARRNVV